MPCNKHFTWDTTCLRIDAYPFGARCGLVCGGHDTVTTALKHFWVLQSGSAQAQPKWGPAEPAGCLHGKQTVPTCGMPQLAGVEPLSGGIPLLTSLVQARASAEAAAAKAEAAAAEARHRKEELQQEAKHWLADLEAAQQELLLVSSPCFARATKLTKPISTAPSVSFHLHYLK